MKESEFQKKLKKEIKERFPGCIVKKNDPSDLQGFPDLIILFKRLWAALEIKKSKSSSHRPNQDHYVKELGEMGFSSFIYPENKEEVLDKLEKYFNS